MLAGRFLFLGSIALALIAEAGSTSALAKSTNTVLLTPLGIAYVSGNYGQTMPEGITTIDTTQVRCNFVGGCVLGLSVMSTVGKATCTDQWAINELVDGNSVDGGPYVDKLPGSERTATRNWQGSYSVRYGVHTVAIQLNVPCPTTAYQWAGAYLVTKEVAK
jgi:hypothetical protein